MFNKEVFAKMKKGAFFINTSRGGVVVEEDLIWALNSGHLSKAAIDVLEREPMSRDNHLCEAKNIIITPHVAWSSIETRRRLLEIVADNIKNYLNKTPSNVVNTCRFLV